MEMHGDKHVLFLSWFHRSAFGPSSALAISLMALRAQDNAMHSLVAGRKTLTRQRHCVATCELPASSFTKCFWTC